MFQCSNLSIQLLNNKKMSGQIQYVLCQCILFPNLYTVPVHLEENGSDRKNKTKKWLWICKHFLPVLVSLKTYYEIPFPSNKKNPLTC